VSGGGRVTVVVTSVIAIETRVRAFTNKPIPSAERGYRTELFSGARATLVSRGGAVRP
jgi:hypothetical protein